DDEDSDYEVVSEPLTAEGSTRRGRGGYDPTADTRRSEARYRGRQRLLLVFAVLAIASVGVGVLMGGIGWAVTGVGVFLLVAYMAYLRRTVRIEERIRRQRSVRAARAARMAQQRRRIEDESPLADEIPEHLIRPGAVVLEIDDEHPVFDHLPPFQRRRVMREEPEFRRAAGE
ncbi:gephyrin-like molybdotransferase receptor GlpR, partial [Williamsia sp.]|uniref:divisome protein SepX/GlpR n=1 Tax=Williamsia sp. TaxID=1872085 RepID=UPI001A1EB6FE|nr:hypothetical protein [Williamsia sp.]